MIANNKLSAYSFTIFCNEDTSFQFCEYIAKLKQYNENYRNDLTKNSWNNEMLILNGNTLYFSKKECVPGNECSVMKLGIYNFFRNYYGNDLIIGNSSINFMLNSQYAFGVVLNSDVKNLHLIDFFRFLSQTECVIFDGKYLLDSNLNILISE